MVLPNSWKIWMDVFGVKGPAENKLFWLDQEITISLQRSLELLEQVDLFHASTAKSVAINFNCPPMKGPWQQKGP